VNDIVVESGNSRFQDVVDAFVSGQQVPDTTLRQAWQNTTVANFVWERPIYEQFFRAVRDVNTSLPKQKQLRLLLGDPPIDWNTVRTADDLLKWLGQRDSSAATIVRDQVLAKHRRALVIYGEGHFWRHNAGHNLVLRLEADGTKVFTVSTPILTDLTSIQPSVSSWPRPSLALLAGTVIGAGRFQQLFGLPDTNGDSPVFEDQVNAVLYLGSPSTMTTSRLPVTLCADKNWVSMRLARMALDPGPPGSPRPDEQLSDNCAKK
jgi:sulfur carrier protein ThiS